MAKERKFNDAREFDAGDKVRFVFDDPTYGDGKKYVGTVIAVSYGEDDRGIRFNYRYTVQFVGPRGKIQSTELDANGKPIMVDDVREIQATGSLLELA